MAHGYTSWMVSMHGEKMRAARRDFRLDALPGHSDLLDKDPSGVYRLHIYD